MIIALSHSAEAVIAKLEIDIYNKLKWFDSKSIHFIFLYLTMVSTSICLDCVSGGRAKKYINKNLKPTLQ